MPKPRLLIVISFSFSIRYIVRTGLLKRVEQFCEPVIAITWNEETLIEELKKEGYEVWIVPENRRGAPYNDVRKRIDIWFDHFLLRGSRKIERAYLGQFIGRSQKFVSAVRRWYNVSKLYLPFYKTKLFRDERSLLEAATNFKELSAFVEALNIDAVFTVTPFHRQEDILLRACKAKGKKMLTSILSFDNITKRGWISIEYDLYLVWNEDNKRQMHRIYPYSRTKGVYVVGAPQFDFYFDQSYLLRGEEWRKITGIPAGHKGKIILYAGGPKTLYPQEPLYLKEIDDAINKGLIKGSPLVLFRCHPMDRMERWKQLMGSSKNIVFDRSWTGTENQGSAYVSDDDIKKLCSTLAYTDVHINICSTMTVDGIAFHKRQIGPAYMPGDAKGSRLLNNFYRQEHFRPVVDQGGVQLVNSEAELINCINASLDGRKTESLVDETILQTIVTYTDGNCTNRVAAEIKRGLINDGSTQSQPEISISNTSIFLHAAEKWKL